MNCASATSFNTATALLQAVLQLQCARVDPVGLRDAVLAAACKVITDVGHI